MIVVQAQAILNANGFPCGKADGIVGPATSTALRLFQEATRYPAEVPVTGQLDTATQTALAALPLLSSHFRVAEVRSKGNGNCYVRRELLDALEYLRTYLGRPLPLVDAYRDPAHNRAVGGAQDSMHQFGLAADLPESLHLTVNTVERLGVFSGIGDRDGIVLHVDCRHHAGSNNATPGASPGHPARWHY